MLKPRCTGNVLDRRHGPLPLLAAPSASRLLTPSEVAWFSGPAASLRGSCGGFELCWS